MPGSGLIARLTRNKRRTWLVSSAVAVALLVLQPFGLESGRVILILALGSALSALIFLSWRLFHLGKFLAVLTLFLILIILRAPPPTDHSLSADVLVESLSSYEGTHYLWAGECARGIDCSGLVRRGMIDSAWKAALSDLDPTLARWAIALWWSDASASFMREGYADRLEVVAEGPTLGEIDPGLLRPGDIAVTLEGRHVLAHLDGGRWIQADPDLRRVTVNERDSDSRWFQMPMRFLRWRIVAGP